MRDFPCGITSRIWASQRHIPYHVSVTEGSYAGQVHSSLMNLVEEEDRSHVCVADGIQAVTSISKAGKGPLRLTAVRDVVHIVLTFMSQPVKSRMPSHIIISICQPKF